MREKMTSLKDTTGSNIEEKKGKGLRPKLRALLDDNEGGSPMYVSYKAQHVHV
jgi:hypothetical protein